MQKQQGEVVLNREHGDRYSELVGLFQCQVNAAYVDPDYIARVRRKLDLDQRQAAELFGGGVNAFSLYENGKTKPPLSLVKLLKLLDRHPDLLSEVRTAGPSQQGSRPKGCACWETLANREPLALIA